MARRQLATHAQSALHARCAARRARRCLSGRGILAGPAEGDRRHHERTSGAADDPRVVVVPAVDAEARRALPAAAVRCASRRTHERVLHGRRQGARQRVLPQRRSARRRHPVRHAGRCDRARRQPFRRGAQRQPAFRGACLRPRRGRLRIEPRMAARRVGAERARRMAGRQLPDSRHTLQPGRAPQAYARRRRGHDRRSVAVALRRHRCARAVV